jgi:methylated-DNA-[protein]-cysteine S-methyltransferase
VNGRSRTVATLDSHRASIRLLMAGKEVRVAIPSISRTNDHGAPLRARPGLQPRGASIDARPVLIVSCRQSLVALTYASGSGILSRAAFVRLALGQFGEYFAGQCREFTLPLDLLPMEPVSEMVLQALRTVGYGKTISYGELAALSGSGVPARAIGEIMAATPVPIIMPCHGVVACNGLGGYFGGEPGRHLETKRWLLENEGALPPALV